MTEYIQMKQSDILEFKKKKYKELNGICPVLGIKLPLEQFVVDHKHRTRNEEIGEEGRGLVRGILAREVNSWEGKITNGFKRYGLQKYNVPIEDALQRLVDFLRYSKTNLIHPSEKPTERKITKNCYNILVKKIKLSNLSYKKKEKIPTYPKSGKLTMALEKLFDKYGVQVQYYAEKKR